MLLLGLTGGAKKGAKTVKAVMKTHLKASADQVTTDAVQQLFADTMNLCKEIGPMREVDVEQMVRDTDITTSKSLMQYLAHDKSNNDHKFDHAGDALSMSQKLSTVQYKIECAKQLLKKMTEGSISEKCGNGKKGIDALVRMIYFCVRCLSVSCRRCSGNDATDTVAALQLYNFMQHGMPGELSALRG